MTPEQELESWVARLQELGETVTSEGRQYLLDQIKMGRERWGNAVRSVVQLNELTRLVVTGDPGAPNIKLEVDHRENTERDTPIKTISVGKLTPEVAMQLAYVVEKYLPEVWHRLLRGRGGLGHDGQQQHE